MGEKEFLAQRFEADRPHLRAVAFRMLGGAAEAEDAVQETWLRLNRAGADGVDNLTGWLTTTLSRVCLDALRARRARREAGVDPATIVDMPSREAPPDAELQLADSVGLAMLVVLEKLAPAERVAFVLHDMFDLPFDVIAPVVGRTTEAARQLASRARRRVRGVDRVDETDRARQRALVEAFLAASRDGDFDGLLAALDPEVAMRSDATATAMGGAAELRGAEAVAAAFRGRARGAIPALVDGAAGLLVVLRGRLRLAVRMSIRDGRIAEIEAIADPDRLRSLDLATLAD
jgi:RNA polymerase sigma-70 factor, ECF subfamily